MLLVFSSPDCGPCNALAPELERFYRTTLASPSMNLALAPSPRPSPPLRERVADRQGEGEIPGLAVVMISKGEPKENRAKVKEHGLTIPVVLQQQWEISRRYAMFATPVAYLIDEQGVITHDVAVGTDAILELLAEAGRMVERTHEVAVA